MTTDYIWTMHMRVCNDCAHTYICPWKGEDNRKHYECPKCGGDGSPKEEICWLK